MKAYVMMTFDHDEIQRNLPYAVIAEVASSARWNTGRCKRLFKERFTESERELCYEIIKKAKKWYLVTGAPDEEKMRASTFAMWERLAEFCTLI